MHLKHKLGLTSLLLTISKLSRIIWACPPLRFGQAVRYSPIPGLPLPSFTRLHGTLKLSGQLSSISRPCTKTLGLISTMQKIPATIKNFKML